MKDFNPNTELLLSYLDGSISNEMEQQVEKWLNKSPENVAKLQQHANRSPVLSHNIDKNSVKKNLLAVIKTTESLEEDFVESAIWKLRPWIKVAAAVLIIICGAWITSPVVQPLMYSITHNQIVGVPETVTNLTLPDGSLVELSPGAILEYPKKFDREDRNVFLKGEAFFVVKKDSLRPFIVFTGEVSTTVLGTEFNVNYSKETEKVEIALVEGSISVSKFKQTESNDLILKPEEWVRYSKENPEFILSKGLEDKLLWKEKTLKFDGRNLIEVSQILERWYGVNIEVTDGTGCDVVGTFTDESLENVLKGLQFATGLEYNLNGKEIELKGYNCK